MKQSAIRFGPKQMIDDRSADLSALRFSVYANCQTGIVIERSATKLFASDQKQKNADHVLPVLCSSDILKWYGATLGDRVQAEGLADDVTVRANTPPQSRQKPFKSVVQRAGLRFENAANAR